MSNLVQTTFDYAVLDEDTRIFIKVKAQDIHARLKRTAEDIIEIGKDLIAVQERLRNENKGEGYRGENQGNGEFVAWLQTEFDMTDRTAYNFMAVAKKFGEKFETVSNFSPRVLYALATASEKVIQKVESGEMEAEAEKKQITLLEAIQLEKRAEKAEEKAKKEEEARIKAEKVAESAHQQLSLFQAESQLDQAEIDHLTQQIEDLQQEMLKLSTPKIQKIEVEKIVEKTIEVPVISEEEQRKIIILQKEKDALIAERERLEQERNEKAEQVKARDEKVILLTQERDALAKETEGLKKLAHDNLFTENQMKYESEVRDRNRQMSNTLEKGLRDTRALFPDPIDVRQVYDADEWARIAHMKNQVLRFIEELDKLKTEVANQFIDVSPVFDIPTTYIESQKG